MRCSRGRLPASGGPPSDRRKPLPPIPSHFLSLLPRKGRETQGPSSLPAWRSLKVDFVAAEPCREIRHSAPPPSEAPSAVSSTTSSAASGRGYTRGILSGDNGPTFFRKRVRCGRGRPPRSDSEAHYAPITCYSNHPFGYASTALGRALRGATVHPVRVAAGRCARPPAAHAHHA